ncbi:phosphoribosylanthranilate isomerase [Litoribrevibacter albus]|uniref:N-(5'-phosphoribosyl)anthranilate isomerase n=1 Tax=Litoribrevibacter albus TaxID=1473156 RepID=A0AA37S9B4_9GAMM|nr:phosphoribosylanthranilate isomerase [Litoribrevibacter albus]GLQ30936.1 N-(5'-phosphoribosyl)anthranilate isomerase [Litoribrevibacter albus]
MTRTRVKICGITRSEDALGAVSAGCDAIGLVFYPPSPRNVSIEQAQQVVANLPPYVTVVGLFVNPDPQMVSDAIEKVGLTCVQFHGDESPEFCNQFNVRWYKAVRVKDDTDLHSYAKSYENASALLLDTYKAGVPGGTGETFNWSLIPNDLPKPVILAGGLEPSNVAKAVQQVRPYAVDVSGGVEAEKAIKSNDKMIAFVQEVLK